MKKRLALVFLLMLLGLAGAALAQEVPGISVFSPGMKRLAQVEAARPAVSAQAQIDLDKAMYARDLSLLDKMLDGTTIRYQRSDAGESVAIERDGEQLGAYAPARSDVLDALEEKLLGTAVLERVPLTAVAAWLEGLSCGDALAFGFAVTQPFAIERTMSDDGMRLTKIRIEGGIAREGEAPWRVSGYLRQPAGRAPKDTFEITLEQDEDNTIELLYSALRENEVTRKNREGTTSVRTTLKAAGKIAGSGISSRLTVSMKNRWNADGQTLSERITISASLGHTDRTPGRRMQRLNDAAAEVKNVIRITTTQEENAPVELTDEITFDVKLDSNTFLAGSADVSMRVGGDAPEAPQNLQAMDETSAKTLAKNIYRMLDEETTNKLEEGL